MEGDPDMSTTLPRIEDTQAYWLGWLAGGIREALRLLEEGDQRTGNYLHDREQAASLLRESLEEYARTTVAESLAATTILDDLYAGWVVEDARGEAQAMRDTYEQADEALTDVESYWWEAENCGHPSAPRYVAELRPFRIRQITRAERDELEEYPPVIDREP